MMSLFPYAAARHTTDSFNQPARVPKLESSVDAPLQNLAMPPVAFHRPEVCDGTVKDAGEIGVFAVSNSLAKHFKAAILGQVVDRQKCRILWHGQTLFWEKEYRPEDLLYSLEYRIKIVRSRSYSTEHFDHVASRPYAIVPPHESQNALVCRPNVTRCCNISASSMRYLSGVLPTRF